MIFRRIYVQFREQNWPAVVTELIILVIGVFAGIESSNWNEARIERQQEREYLVRLHEDVLASAEGIRRDNVYLEQQLSDQALVLAALEECTVDPENQAEVERGLKTLGFINPPRFFKRTYEELAASGRMDIIQSDAIKVELAGMVHEFEFRQSVQDSVFRLLDSYRMMVEQQLRYDISQALLDPETRPRVVYRIEDLCKEPKNALVVSAISFHTLDRLQAAQDLHQRYMDFLPVLESELKRRWGQQL